MEPHEIYDHSKKEHSLNCLPFPYVPQFVEPLSEAVFFLQLLAKSNSYFYLDQLPCLFQLPQYSKLKNEPKPDLYVILLVIDLHLFVCNFLMLLGLLVFFPGA